MQTCSQCNRQAMYDINGHLLCLEHRTMLVNSMQQNVGASLAMMNYLHDQIDWIMGNPNPSPRIEVPQPIINNAPITHNTTNNIKVSRSVVGTINTAQVARIDVAMDHIKNTGNVEVSDAVKELAQAVINSQELEVKARETLVEQLAFLSEQATLPKQQRQVSVIKMVLKAVPPSIASVAGLSELWTKHGKILIDFFS